jgi:hypothetical protein
MVDVVGTVDAVIVVPVKRTGVPTDVIVATVVAV